MRHANYRPTRPVEMPGLRDTLRRPITRPRTLQGAVMNTCDCDDTDLTCGVCDGRSNN